MTDHKVIDRHGNIAISPCCNAFVLCKNKIGKYGETIDYFYCFNCKQLLSTDDLSPIIPQEFHPRLDNNNKVVCFEFRSIGSINSYQTIGIVLTVNSIGEVTCRIGLCISEHEQFDVNNIALSGGKLLIDEAIGFFPHEKDFIIKNWKKY